MNDQTVKTQRIAVIGGGIAGLAAAHRVVELAPTASVTLLEAGDRLGGVIGTVRARWIFDRTQRRQLYHQCAVGDRSVPADRFRRPIDSDQFGESGRDGRFAREAAACAGRFFVDDAVAIVADSSFADFELAREAATGLRTIRAGPAR